MTKILEIKSSDIECKREVITDLKNWNPGTLESFAILYSMNIGFKGEKSADYFSLVAISHDVFEKQMAGPKYIVMPVFQVELFFGYVENVISLANSAKNPLAVLRAHFDWEFEQMSPAMDMAWD